MERDDVFEYSLETHHSEEKGKKIRKKIYFVTILLSVITAVEVALGAFIKQGTDLWPVVKISFIIMTLVKAGYIVFIFMHLGDEKLELRRLILFPYFVFAIYLMYILMFEGTAVNAAWIK
jgi:cytochrome c oxidase subunit IV